MKSALEEARGRDAADPLAPFRTRFALPRNASGAPLVYLCGHSLGLLPLAARELVTEELDDWARLGVEGHEHARRPWIPYHENLTAGLAAFMGASFYGSASCVDASGYELYVIASAVVGGASLAGGKGSAINATLGALLIVLIRQSIRTLHFDQNYEWIIIGCATIVAVVLDRTNASFTARRLARAAK